MGRLLAAISIPVLMAAEVVVGDPPSMPVVNGTSRPLVQVFQFTSVNNQSPQDWIGQGIQANLQTDVSQTGAILVMAPKPPAAGSDPVAAARQDGANLAVVGSYQIVADQVRVNAHLVDTASSNTVGSFSATGPQQDLFKIEDALGEQLRRLLPLPAAPAPVATAQGAQQAPNYQPAVQQVASAGPSVVAYNPPPDGTPNYYTTTPVVTTPYYYPDSFYSTYYGSDYYYPDYGYYGGIYIGGPFYYGGWGGRFHDYGGFGGFRGGIGFRGAVYNGGGFRGGGGFHGGGGGGGGFHGGVGGGGGFHGGGGGFHGSGGGGRR
jgi:TolB-like protein